MSDERDTVTPAPGAPSTLGGFYRSGVTAAMAPITHDRLALADAYAQVFDSAAGQIVWADLIKTTGAFDTPIVAGESTHETYRRLGRHEVGLHLLNRRRWAQAQFGQFDAPTTLDKILEQERYAGGDDPAAAEEAFP